MFARMNILKTVCLDKEKLADQSNDFKGLCFNLGEKLVVKSHYR